jgi:uncharacterized protein
MAVVWFEVYRDAAGGYRWRLWAANNEIVAISSEAYQTRTGAEQSAQWVKNNAPFAPIR